MEVVVIGSSRSESDKNLAARFAREAEPLFEVLSRGARRLTRCDADAEDLLQETLLHAYAGFHTFQAGTNLKAWLFRILYNRWVSTYRSRQSRPAEVLDALPDNEIKAAMDSLPEGFRTAVYYADVEGYTLAETAALLNIPARASWSWSREPAPSRLIGSSRLAARRKARFITGFRGLMTCWRRCGSVRCVARKPRFSPS
jgi:RNA polymerase sigma factor (sigma-70 family)